MLLNGQWDVQDSVGAEDQPQQYGHTAPVPGLAHSAVPAFADVDQFQSRELLSNLVRKGMYTQAEYDRLGSAKGISHQARNYFWYRKTFTGPAQRTLAVLKVSKAQFGTVVYLNGVRIGEHDPCFTAAWFDVTRAIRWNAPNELVIRIGAHPNVLPANVSEGTDFEKNRWTPGIYDDVALFAADNPFVSNVQVAPQIGSGSALVQTELHNYSDRAVTTTVRQQVFERKGHGAASAVIDDARPGGCRCDRHGEADHSAAPCAPVESRGSVPLQRGHEDRRRQRGDTLRHARNPLRHAHAPGVSQRQTVLLRGSNITLHRFFEDPEVGTLPWDEAWLKRLLVDIPKSMHWNAFRFCIGPVPDRWLEIADENGLLIQNEYMVWVGRNWGAYKPSYDEAEITAEYTEWMRDNWNHPSVAIWDATNESWLPGFSERIIPAVRGMDLSNRAWEDSYNAPAGANDPVEDHQYLLQKLSLGAAPSAPDFKISDLENMLGPAPTGATYKAGHASILNEYGWLWLNRDGTPTLLTDKLYPRLLGEQEHNGESVCAGCVPAWRRDGVLAGVPALRGHPALRVPDGQRSEGLHLGPLSRREDAHA